MANVPKKVKINGQVLYFDKLDTSGDDSLRDLIDLTEQQMKEAVMPIVEIGKQVKEAVAALNPEETELTINFSLSLEGSTPIFKVMTGSAEAQFSVKFKL